MFFKLCAWDNSRENHMLIVASDQGHAVQTESIIM